MTFEAEMYLLGRVLIMAGICYAYWRAGKWLWRRLIRGRGR